MVKSTQINQEENNSLKKEIEILKNEISRKDENIKQISNKLKTLENESKNFNNILQECSEKFNDEISKKNEDLEFYKKSYEEQKGRVNKEHELISNSLYDLALQFMGLKNELQKKVGNNINSNSNLKRGSEIVDENGNNIN